jgi:hypothetical protein
MIAPLKLPKKKVEAVFGLFYYTGMLVWFFIGYLTCIQIACKGCYALEHIIRR